MRSSLLFVTAFALFTAACKPVALAPEAARVLATRQPAPAHCAFLGTVVGTQGGAFSGKYTSNENLSIGAMNDLKNKAARLGANYVVIENALAGNTFSGGGGGVAVASSPRSGFHFGGGGSGGQTDVTYTGNAFRCDDVQTALAAAPSPDAR
jgi:uncharacterized protein YbjQ (UPF0145 family)